MRTYILALSKYPIALFMIAYAVISFLQVRKIGGDRGDERRTNALLVLLLFLVHAFGMLTIFVAMKDVRYLYFWLFQAVVFGFYIVLYRNLYPKANQTLCIHICMMLSIGLIIITRLSFSKAAKQFVIASAGMILTIAVPALMKKFHFMKKLTYIYALTGMAALSVVLLLGQVTQGSKLTWSVFGVTMQPSEFVKILFVFYLASAYYESAEWKDVLRAGIFAMLHVLILVASKDLGSALIFFVAFVFMTYLASGKWQYLLLGAFAGGIGAVAAYHVFTHVQVRVQAWRDPWSVIDSMGYQITQSLFSICSGGPFGMGLTQGTPDKIPYVESDFIFSAITEEMGMIVSVSLLIMCLVLFFNILWISLNFSDRFYRFTAFGFAVMYIFQAFLTVGGDSKFIPLTGVTLPLVSYGGSSVLSTIFMFSVVEALYIMQQERLSEFRERFRRRQKAGGRIPARTAQTAQTAAAAEPQEKQAARRDISKRAEKPDERRGTSQPRKKPAARRDAVQRHDQQDERRGILQHREKPDSAQEDTRLRNSSIRRNDADRRRRKAEIRRRPAQAPVQPAEIYYDEDEPTGMLRTEDTSHFFDDTVSMQNFYDNTGAFGTGFGTDAGTDYTGDQPETGKQSYDGIYSRETGRFDSGVQDAVRDYENSFEPDDQPEGGYYDETMPIDSRPAADPSGRGGSGWDPDTGEIDLDDFREVTYRDEQ